MKIQNNKTIQFGSHLIFDAYGCNPDKLDDPAFSRKILDDCTRICDMKQLITPVIVEVTPNDALGGKDPGGNSGFVIIQLSHISIHTFTKKGFVTMDIYSCKEFDPIEVTTYLKEAFEAKDTDVIYMKRGLKYPAENIYK